MRKVQNSYLAKKDSTEAVKAEEQYDADVEFE